MCLTTISTLVRIKLFQILALFLLLSQFFDSLYANLVMQDKTYYQIFWTTRFETHSQHMVPDHIVGDDNSYDRPGHSKPNSKSFPQNWTDHSQKYPCMIAHQVIESHDEARSNDTHTKANNCKAVNLITCTYTQSSACRRLHTSSRRHPRSDQ